MGRQFRIVNVATSKEEALGGRHLWCAIPNLLMSDRSIGVNIALNV